MGIRKRDGQSKMKLVNKSKLREAHKEFTRAKALSELNTGADPSDDKFTKHRNSQVRMRAFHLSGGIGNVPVPNGPGDKDSVAKRHEIFENLTRNRSNEAVAKLKNIFGC